MSVRDVNPEDLGGGRVDLLSPLKEKLDRSAELAFGYKDEIRNIAGLAAPTGVGKTTFATRLAVALALKKREYGEPGKVVIVVPNKETRTEVLARLAERVAEIKEAGEDPPKALVVFSKVDTCINESTAIREILDEIRAMEREGGDPEKIRKLVYLFYSRCANLSKKGKCAFHSNAKEAGERVVKSVLGSGYIYVVGTLAPETVERMRKLSPKLASMLEREGTVPYTVDIKDVAKAHKVCPYGLVAHLAEESDIIVVDSAYFNTALFRYTPFAGHLVGPFNILIIDETHELFRNIYPSVEVSEGSPIGETGVAREMLAVIDDIIRAYNIREAEHEYEGKVVRVAVPENSLDPERLEKLKGVLALARKGLKQVRQALARRLAESDISLLREALALERVGRVSDLANRGILAFMGEYEGDEIVRGWVIPVAFAKKLTSGKDFAEAIHLSATLLPQHLSMIHHIRSEKASEIIATVPWDVVRRNRRTILVRMPSNLSSRGRISEVIKELLARAGKDKVLVVATSTWGDLLRKVASEAGYEYYTPKSVRTQEAKDAEARKIMELLEGEGRVMLHISPHTSFGVGVNLMRAEAEADVLVLAPSEAILPPISETNTEAAVVMRKYSPLKLSWWEAWYITNVTRCVLRVVQAVGRVQRGEKQKVTIVMFGRHFKRVLSKFYGPLFGKFEVLENVEGDDPARIAEKIAEVMENAWKEEE